jgi:hypothetical protein
MLLFASFASLAYANFFFDSIGVIRSPRALSLFTCCLSCMSNNFLFERVLLKLLPRCELLRFAFEFALLKNYLLVYLYLVLFKGGIPAAPSGTATLLRLSPSHRFYPRQLPYGSPSSGTPDSHGLTGGVYKVRERIHRAMLMRDY